MRDHPVPPPQLSRSPVGDDVTGQQRGEDAARRGKCLYRTLNRTASHLCSRGKTLHSHENGHISSSNRCKAHGQNAEQKCTKAHLGKMAQGDRLGRCDPQG